jgi:hypothetical protein
LEKIGDLINKNKGKFSFLFFNRSIRMIKHTSTLSIFSATCLVSNQQIQLDMCPPSQKEKIQLNKFRCEKEDKKGKEYFQS